MAPTEERSEELYFVKESNQIMLQKSKSKHNKRIKNEKVYTFARGN